MTCRNKETLRSGHAKHMRDYKHLFLKTDPTGFCIHCDLDAPETIKHVMCECPQLETKRRSIFDGPVEMSMMTSEPEIC